MISADWIHRSIAPHAQAREDTGYGYLWWLPVFHAHGRDFRCFAMYGTGGNKVYVLPQEQLVVVVTTVNFHVAGAGALTDRLLTEHIWRRFKKHLDRGPGAGSGLGAVGALRRVTPPCRGGRETTMQRMVHDYLRALEAGDADRAAALFIPDGCVESPFLGRLPVKQFVKKVADSSRGTKLTVHDVLVSAEGHLRAVAYYQYDWRLKDGSRVSFDCADVFNFDPSTGHIQSIVLVYDTHPVRAVVENKYP